jgi:hypothetical protein
MTDSDMSDSGRPEPSIRRARASTVKQRAVDRPPIKKRTAKKANADFDADAKLRAAAVVIDDKDKQLRDKDQLVREKDKQLRDKDQLVREKEHEVQFMASQVADIEREKIAARDLATQKDREVANLSAELYVVKQQSENMVAERQAFLREGCVSMATAVQAYMDADHALDMANAIGDNVGEILSSMEAIVHAEPQRPAHVAAEAPPQRSEQFAADARPTASRQHRTASQRHNDSLRHELRINREVEVGLVIQNDILSSQLEALHIQRDGAITQRAMERATSRIHDISEEEVQSRLQQRRTPVHVDVDECDSMDSDTEMEIYSRAFERATRGRRP